MHPFKPARDLRGRAPQFSIGLHADARQSSARPTPQELQSLFDTPPSLPADRPVVTVRRARRASLPAGQPSAASDEREVEEAKSPRVFIVERPGVFSNAGGEDVKPSMPLEAALPDASLRRERRAFRKPGAATVRVLETARDADAELDPEQQIDLPELERQLVAAGQSLEQLSMSRPALEFDLAGAARWTAIDVALDDLRTAVDEAQSRRRDGVWR